MIIRKNISFARIFKWSWHHLTWIILGTTIIAILYKYKIITFQIPWLPISIIGTAVAFYVGFKNNSAYSRMWEARKIWGAIINSSRAWGMSVDSFVSNLFVKGDEYSAQEIHEVKKQLIYRHIAWTYALRCQLLVPTPWEHSAQNGMVGRTAKHYQKRYGIGLVADEVTKTELKNFLSYEENENLSKYANSATQILNQQARQLAKLRESNLIEDFRHMEMQKILQDFYVHQGKCERIKKFPLPRQYANMSRVFTIIFLSLLPFAMIPELMKVSELGLWFAIPLTAVIGWVYVMMELIGDYSENPFQGMANDIPMLSLCRTIEIDLREMLDETNVPDPIQPKKGILM
ncbi:MAG: hypothetical protein GY827_10710 [Cytophagales bacterium]|nr:hypothetical protein [Cytophagales bacterium]